MIKQWIVLSGQSVYDLSLQLYGSLDYIFKIITDNNLGGLDTPIVSGTVINYDASIIANFSNVKRNSQLNIIYSTLQSNGDFNNDFNADFLI